MNAATSNTAGPTPNIDMRAIQEGYLNDNLANPATHLKMDNSFEQTKPGTAGASRGSKAPYGTVIHRNSYVKSSLTPTPIKDFAYSAWKQQHTDLDSIVVPNRTNKSVMLYGNQETASTPTRVSRADKT